MSEFTAAAGPATTRSPDPQDLTAQTPAAEPPSPLDRVAAAVAAVPGVAGLDGGPFGEVTTYLPGRRLAGVADRGDRLSVSVVARQGNPLPALADRIRAAVRAVDPRPVQVVIADLDAEL